MSKLIEYICKHCKNIQYLPLTFVPVYSKIVCYVCGNKIHLNKKEKENE